MSEVDESNFLVNLKTNSHTFNTKLSSKSIMDVFNCDN